VISEIFYIGPNCFIYSYQMIISDFLLHSRAAVNHFQYTWTVSHII